MTIKGKIKDVKNEEIRIQNLENFLHKSVLMMVWREMMNIAQCSVRNE